MQLGDERRRDSSWPEVPRNVYAGDPLALVGGVPFIDRAFHPQRALTAAAVMRWHASGCSSAQSLAWFAAPLNAICVAHVAYPPHPPIEASLLSDEHSSALIRAKAIIIGQKPEWRDLVYGPVLFLHLNTRGSFSLTNPVIPQCVFLGDEPFEEGADLCETVVHELAHVWLSLIHEFAPLVQADDRPEHTLPSGTKGKTTLGALLAAHFAASALAFHAAGVAGKHARLIYLRDYLEGCMRILRQSSRLTFSGRCVRDILESFRADCASRW